LRDRRSDDAFAFPFLSKNLVALLSRSGFLPGGDRWQQVVTGGSRRRLGAHRNRHVRPARVVEVAGRSGSGGMAVVPQQSTAPPLTAHAVYPDGGRGPRRVGARRRPVDRRLGRASLVVVGHLLAEDMAQAASDEAAK
jgi:hypothetical protein